VGQPAHAMHNNGFPPSHTSSGVATAGLEPETICLFPRRACVCWHPAEIEYVLHWASEVASYDDGQGKGGEVAAYLYGLDRLSRNVKGGGEFPLRHSGRDAEIADFVLHIHPVGKG